MTRNTSGLLTILACAAACKEKPPAAAPPLPVTVTVVGSGGGAGDDARYAGSVRPDASVDVAFKVSGLVESVTQITGADGRLRNLQDGDQVRRGTVLASLRQNEFRDQVQDAEATARQSQADFERAAQLYENRSVSKADYDAAYARYTASQARRSQALLSLGDATLRAPIDGVILKRTVEVGSLAGPTLAAFTIADTRNVKVVFGVPDVTVTQLKPGGSLAISAEALPGVPLTGKITRIAASADPNSRVFEVEATLPNRDGKLKVGMLTSLSLAPRGSDSGVVIPLAAVIRPAADSAGYAVFTVCDSMGTTVARLTRIELGTVRGNLIAVTSGLTPGDRVILRGATIASDGKPVQVIP